MRAKSGVFTASLALCLLTGCSAIKDQPPPRLVDAALGGAALRKPENMAEIENFVSSCMRRSGFQYRPQAPIPQQQRTLEQVQAEGFGISFQSFRSLTHADTNREYFASLTPNQANDYVRAMSGPRNAKSLKDAGCRGTAESRYLPPPEFAVVINTKLDEMDKALRSDAQYLTAGLVYPACMSYSGFRNQDGATLRSKIAKDVDSGVPPQQPSSSRTSRSFGRFHVSKEAGRPNLQGTAKV